MTIADVVSNTVAAKIAEFLAHGRAILMSHGVAPGQFSEGPVEWDRAVWYLRVDGESVYRVIAVPDDNDGEPAVAFYGTFLPAAFRWVGDPADEEPEIEAAPPGKLSN